MDKEFIVLFLGLTFKVILFMVLLLVIFAVLHADGSRSDCERLQSYNIDARIEFLDCYVYMEDGSKVWSGDFNIATIKVPRSIR